MQLIHPPRTAESQSLCPVWEGLPAAHSQSTSTVGGAWGEQKPCGMCKAMSGSCSQKQQGEETLQIKATGAALVQITGARESVISPGLPGREAW